MSKSNLPTAADFNEYDIVQYENGHGNTTPQRGIVRTVGRNWLRVADENGATVVISIDRTVKREGDEED